MTVTLNLVSGTRYFNGIVRRISQSGYAPGMDGPQTFLRYRAELVPKFWLLTRNSQSRIFQQQAVPDILKTVLSSLDVSYQLQGTYQPRDYCVQYRETDFDFACRLMEDEGIFYFFTHANGSHQMVVSDTPTSHPTVPGPASVNFDPVVGGQKPDDRVLHWEKSQQVRTGNVRLWDYRFEMTDKNLEATAKIQASAAAGTVTHTLTAGGGDQFEFYDYPGGYAERFDGEDSSGADASSALQKVFDDNTRTAGVRIAQEAAQALEVTGEGNCRHFTSGHKFTLAAHFNANGDYILSRVTHSASILGAYSNPESSSFAYRNQFNCIPSALPFHPQRTTRRPVVEGSQTAVVVGPSGEEIFTDQYGRIKVQFHWDRVGTNDASSSCWLRVATLWAGKQWGSVHIPRIGQEVVVDFLEGDPNQPIVVGSVYNATEMPPYTLPDNMTQSGLKSRSTPQGSTDNFNELRFEDKKGSELVYVQAEKDFTRLVKNNDQLTVQADQTIEVDKNRTTTIKQGDDQYTLEQGNRTQTLQQGNDTYTLSKGDRSQTLSQGNDTLELTQGNRTETLKQGDDSLTLSQGNKIITLSNGDLTTDVANGNRTATVKSNDTLTVEGSQTETVTSDAGLTVKSGNRTVTASQGDITIEASAGNVTIQAGSSITLKVGSNSVTINQQGITVNGMQVAVKGTGQAQVTSPMTSVSGSGTLTLKGGATMIN